MELIDSWSVKSERSISGVTEIADGVIILSQNNTEVIIREEWLRSDSAHGFIELQYRIRCQNTVT